jgi:hypothetical protein
MSNKLFHNFAVIGSDAFEKVLSYSRMLQSSFEAFRMAINGTANVGEVTGFWHPQSGSYESVSRLSVLLLHREMAHSPGESLAFCVMH